MWNSSIGLINDHSFVTQVNQNLSLVQGYPKVALTPNAMEFSRLAKSVLHREVLAMMIDLCNVGSGGHSDGVD